MLDVVTLLGCLVHGMDPAMLRAIVEHESLDDPLALHVNRWEGRPVKATSREDAVETARRFVAAGYSVDVGLAGINSQNLDRLGVSIDAAFEPCTNVALGESIFVENLERARAAGHVGDEAARVALSLYNTGSMSRGFNNGYVDAVWQRYRRHRLLLARTARTVIDWAPRDAAVMPKRAVEPSSPASTIVPWTTRSAESRLPKEGRP